MAVTTVGEVMMKDVPTLSEEDDLAHARTLMLQNRTRHLPVVGGDGHLIGLISQRDLLRLRESPFSGTSSTEQEVIDRETKVGNVMTQRLRTASPTTPLIEAAEMLRDQPISCIPVVDGERLVGLITGITFIEMIVGQLEKES